MFLDDELKQIAKEYTINKPEDVQDLFKILCEKCEKHYKSKLSENMTNLEVKALLDRTFKLWDNFVVNSEKSDNRQLIILSGLFKKYNFKNSFLINPDMRKIYYNL